LLGIFRGINSAVLTSGDRAPIADSDALPPPFDQVQLDTHQIYAELQHTIELPSTSTSTTSSLSLSFPTVSDNNNNNDNNNKYRDDLLFLSNAIVTSIAAGDELPTDRNQKLYEILYGLRLIPYR